MVWCRHSDGLTKVVENLLTEDSFIIGEFDDGTRAAAVCIVVVEEMALACTSILGNAARVMLGAPLGDIFV